MAAAILQAPTTTDSISGRFPETPRSDLPWSHNSKCTKTLFQGPRYHKAGGSRRCPWGSSVPIPRCHVPNFQNVCPEIRGPRRQQVPRIPEPPCSLQQPVQALEQAPANNPPCSDAEPAPLSDFSVKCAAAESVLPSKVFLPGSTPQSPVCVAASCSCKAPWFNWPAVAPTMQDAPNPGDYANRDIIASREEGIGSYHLILHIPRAESRKDAKWMCYLLEINYGPM